MTHIQVRRGDEHIMRTATRVSTGQFCTLHGAQKPIYVLKGGSYYAACRLCFSNSIHITIIDAEEDK